MLGLKLGIDFGSTNITIFAEGKGIVMSEPSVIVCDRHTGRVIATGNAAIKMANKLPDSMYTVYPIRDGIINDYDSACYLLRTYINKLCHGKLLKPSVLICVPSVVTSLQQKTLFDAVMASGAGRACFVEETLAAAAGAGIDFLSPQAHLICDIGGDVCNIAVVTSGGIAVSETVDIGGNTLTRCVEDHIAHKYNIKTGFSSAEKIKISAGAAVIRQAEVGVISSGKRFDNGEYVYFEITSNEIYDVLQPKLNDILTCITGVLRKTPPELCGDINKNGMLITGGTALLYGIAEFISAHTGISTHCANEPAKCAALGLGRLLGDLKYLERSGYVFRSDSEKPTDEEN